MLPPRVNHIVRLLNEGQSWRNIIRHYERLGMTPTEIKTLVDKVEKKMKDEVGSRQD